MVGPPSVRGGGPVWKCPGGVEQTLRQVAVEQKRWGACAGTTGAYPHGGVLDAFLDDQPVEEAADDAQKMVVAARRFTLARAEERLDEHGIDS